MSKLKLPCCKYNEKSPLTEWDCSYCECSFRTMDLVFNHVRVFHSQQFTAKRKLTCCNYQEIKRQKFGDEGRDQKCHYYECMFRNENDHNNHVNAVHKCICGEIVLTADVRAQHKAKHAYEAKIAELEALQAHREAQLEQLQDQRQHRMDDDFVLKYVKTNKLDEYEPQPDYKPRGYIISNHDFEKEELVRFVKKFKDEFLESVSHKYDIFESNTFAGKRCAVF